MRQSIWNDIVSTTVRPWDSYISVTMNNEILDLECLMVNLDR